MIRNDGDESGAQLLGRSIVNAFVIVAVITVMTFVVVLLYKYRCMKILLGYMIFASFLLLTVLSARMLEIAVERYEFTLDYITYAILLYNFGFVGVYSIFWAQGVPKYITQIYLVLTSVFVAWELSHFDEYTAWALLVLLALYDLYAVLTPYGPLQFLVKMMQSPNAPSMPGLLYEAHVGGGGDRGGSGGTSSRRNNDRNNDRSQWNDSNQQSQQNDNESDRQSTSNAHSDSEVPSSPERGTSGRANSVTEIENNATNQTTESFRTPPRGDSDVERVAHEEADIQGVETALTPTRNGIPSGTLATHETSPDAVSEPTEVRRDTGPVDVDAVTEAEEHQLTQGHRRIFQFDQSYPRVFVPLALAKLYRMPLENDPQPRWLQPPPTEEGEAYTYSVEELNSVVTAVAPLNGGIIRPHADQIEGQETRYQVVDATGQVRRVLFVNSSNGRVFEVHNYEEALAAYKNRNKPKRETIRLGLGDFIFYSVLVSKAALFSWTTFCATTLVILVGLGMTLLLLASLGKALPALPISIFLGVSFYLTTRYLLEPWVEELFQQTSYV